LIGVKPRRTWKEAVVRYLAETADKTTQVTDKMHLRWLDPYLNGLTLDEINRDLLDRIKAKRMANSSGPCSKKRGLWIEAGNMNHWKHR
jgi:hypothetical protein